MGGPCVGGVAVTWALYAKQTIDRVLAKFCKDKGLAFRPKKFSPADQNELRALLREAYPFGERAHWPYTVWLREVRRALGVEATPRRGGKRKDGNVGQGSLVAAPCGPVRVKLDFSEAEVMPCSAK